MSGLANCGCDRPTACDFGDAASTASGENILIPGPTFAREKAQETSAQSEIDALLTEMRRLDDLLKRRPIVSVPFEVHASREGRGMNFPHSLVLDK